MRLRDRGLVVLGGAAVLALVGVPAAAMAAVGDWDGSSLWYPFANDGTDPATDSNYLQINSGSTNGLYNETWINSGASKPAWDSSWVVSNTFDSSQLDCDQATADRVNPADTLGGVILRCAGEILNTPSGPATVTREFRVFGDGMTTSMKLTITNSGATPVSGAELDVHDNFYCDGWTNVEWSTTGGSNIADWAAGGTDASGHVVDADDLAYVLDAPGDVFSGGIGCPTVLSQRGAAGAQVLPTQGSQAYGGDARGHTAHDSNETIFTAPTLAAGDSVAFVIVTRYYHFAYAGGDEVITKANARVVTDQALDDAVNDDLSTFALAGAATPRAVLNWSAAAAPPSAPAPAGPTLASTGVNAKHELLVLLGGVSAMFLGSALIAWSRRPVA